MYKGSNPQIDSKNVFSFTLFPRPLAGHAANPNVAPYQCALEGVRLPALSPCILYRAYFSRAMNGSTRKPRSILRISKTPYNH